MEISEVYFCFGYFSNISVNITPKMQVFILEMCDKFASSFWSDFIALFMKLFYCICSIYGSFNLDAIFWLEDSRMLICIENDLQILNFCFTIDNSIWSFFIILNKYKI